MRSVSQQPADAAAVKAIAQACVNIELFTIPLYMTAMYSISGMHPIVGKGNAFYQNRLWPGAATVAQPENANERAFNLIFSVFIEEMLHLQMAANIASAVGVTPSFTSPALCNKRHAWVCYGPDKTTIPHIIDLKDTIHGGLTVQAAGLSADQIELFHAIEESAVIARANLADGAETKYFPKVPFAGWTTGKIETDLPMFGTIDHMYSCFYAYLTLEYDDGSTLWDHVFVPDSVQNDMFNYEDADGHPQREFPGFSATITTTKPATALRQVAAMMNAITDQGEGSLLSVRLEDDDDIDDVKSAYQASDAALRADYPQYTDTGLTAPSSDAVARNAYGKRDHYERFTELAGYLAQVETWPQWRKRHGPWVASDFVTTDEAHHNNPYGLPGADDIADACNRMAAPGARDAMYAVISRATVGTLAGITTVLNEYWANPGVVFPYPAMTGSGDRVATCWALFAQPPDLSLEVDDAKTNVLYHACQALDLTAPGNNCAPVVNFHSCRGSNSCAGRGGCGFVHPAGQPTPGAACGFALSKSKAVKGDADLFSAPSDNRCATRGGCAVPISATQVFPDSGTMQLVDFGPDATPEPFSTMEFNRGEKVHDVAYRAFVAVMKHRDPHSDLPDTAPEPTDIRLVFPPST